MNADLCISAGKAAKTSTSWLECARIAYLIPGRCLAAATDYGVECTRVAMGVSTMWDGRSRDALLRQLLLASLRPDDEHPRDSLNALKEKADRAWSWALDTLGQHDLLPWLGFCVSRCGLRDGVPSEFAVAAEHSYSRTRVANRALAFTLLQTLAAMRARNVVPVILKGFALCDRYWPDLGARPMTDIDLWILPQALESADAALRAVGFESRVALPEKDAVSYADSKRAVIDLHTRCRMFEPAGIEQVSEFRQPTHLSSGPLRFLKPAETIAHLTVHTSEHRRGGGLTLLRLLDILNVLTAEQRAAEAAAILAALPDKAPLRLFEQLLDFFQREFDVAFPTARTHGQNAWRPLTLEGILRERRLAAWGLPRWRGWARLCVGGIGLRSYPQRPYPRLFCRGTTGGDRSSMAERTQHPQAGLLSEYTRSLSNTVYQTADPGH